MSSRLRSRADKKLIAGVNVFDLFEAESLGAGKKSLALEVTLQPTEKTLTDEEIEARRDASDCRRRQGDGRRDPHLRQDVSASVRRVGRASLMLSVYARMSPASAARRLPSTRSRAGSAASSATVSKGLACRLRKSAPVSRTVASASLAALDLPGLLVTDGHRLGGEAPGNGADGVRPVTATVAPGRLCDLAGRGLGETRCAARTSAPAPTPQNPAARWATLAGSRTSCE